MTIGGFPKGSFRNDARWRGDIDVVEFTLDVHAGGKKHEFRCRVSDIALLDASNRKGGLDAKTAIALYRRFQSRIHTAIDRKLKAGTFDADGVILITTADLNP